MYKKVNVKLREEFTDASKEDVNINLYLMYNLFQ